MFAEAFAGFLAKIIAILGLSISLTITPVAPITESGHVSGSPIIGEQIAIATTSIGTQSTSSASLETRPKGSGWLTELPLGDGKYVTSGPKKGFIYLCNVGSAGGGAQNLRHENGGTDRDRAQLEHVEWPVHCRFAQPHRGRPDSPVSPRGA